MTVDLRRKNEVRLAASPSLFAIHILFFSADMNVITKKKKILMHIPPLNMFLLLSCKHNYNCNPLEQTSI